MEKPVIGRWSPARRRMLKLNEEATQENSRSRGPDGPPLPGRQELKKRIENGELGELILLRAYRLGGRAAAHHAKTEKDPSELLYQIRRFHSFLWSSAGCSAITTSPDRRVQLDEGQLPVSAWHGRTHYRENYVDQNFDV